MRSGKPNDQGEFWSAVAQRYDRVVDLQIGPNTRSMVRDRAAREGWLGDVAEFGCGTGFFTSVLAQKADRVVATDISAGMLQIAMDRIRASNVTFQREDCQNTSFSAGAFDVAFISLVIHFTEPDKTVAEMHRILKPGGKLIVANLDLGALTGFARARSLIRIVCHGLTGYRIRPPRGFGQNVMTDKQLCDLLERSDFRVVCNETIRNSSRSSNIPIEYVLAVKR